jgi:hypothetical protein
MGSMHPALRFSSIALFLLAGVMLVAAGFDDRVIAGQNIWIKPFKFSVSIAIYLVTFGLILQFLEPVWRKRYARSSFYRYPCDSDFDVCWMVSRSSSRKGPGRQAQEAAHGGGRDCAGTLESTDVIFY